MEDELEKEFGENFEEVDDSNDINWILKAQGQSITIPAGKKENKDSVYPLAKDTLILDETAVEKSPYVNYTDANENTILCRVLFNDEDGIDIISDDSVTTVTLGYGDTNENVTASSFTYTGSGTMDDNSKKAAASYNRVFTTLNEVAESYRNKIDGIAESARCVGSPRGTTVNTPDSSNYYTGTYSYMSKYSWNGMFKNTDTYYLTDFEKI